MGIVRRSHLLFPSLSAGNVFITYSVDTHKEIPKFASFLINQGFKPAVSEQTYTVCDLQFNRFLFAF